MAEEVIQTKTRLLLMELLKIKLNGNVRSDEYYFVKCFCHMPHIEMKFQMETIVCSNKKRDGIA